MKTQKYSQEDALLSSSIMLAIELDSSFKLYSFRIISPEQYVSRTKELIGNYQHSIKKNTNNTPNLTLV